MARIAAWRTRLLQVHPDHFRIARGAARVAVFVIAGRGAGAVKEMAVAYRYGTSHVVDAYLIATTLVTWLPAAFVSVLGIVLVPTFVQLRDQTNEVRARFLGELEAWAILIGILFVAIVYIVWPFALQVMAGGLAPQTRDMAHQMTVLTAPNGILILLLCAYSCQLQASERHINTLLESLPAVFVLMLVLAWPNGTSIWPLTLGTIAGYLAQAILLRFAARRDEKVRARPRITLTSQQWVEIYRGVGVFMLGQLVSCCAPVLDQYFVAHLGNGAVATLGYTNRVLSLLLTVGPLAIGQAMLPILSDILGSGARARARATALKWAYLVFTVGTVAAGVAWLLAPFAIRLLFQRGAFTEADTVAVASLLRWGLLQVPFYFATLVMMTLFASARRYRTMAAIAVTGFAFKALGNLVFTSLMGISGVLLATALMYACVLASYLLVSRTLVRPQPDLVLP